MVERHSDEGKPRILLADLSDSLKRDVDAIISQYGTLKHTELLQTVYGKYPAYAKKNRLRSLQKSE